MATWILIEFGFPVPPVNVTPSPTLQGKILASHLTERLPRFHVTPGFCTLANLTQWYMQGCWCVTGIFCLALAEYQFSDTGTLGLHTHVAVVQLADHKERHQSWVEEGPFRDNTMDKARSTEFKKSFGRESSWFLAGFENLVGLVQTCSDCRQCQSTSKAAKESIAKR